MTLLGKSLLELRALVEKKELSEKETFEYFLERSKKYNTNINAYLTYGENDGFPIAVKDNFCTKGLRTTASSKVLENFVPQYESTVTDRLKHRGFGILGKTNMDAWAHGSSTETSDFGPTKNPWNNEYVAGGSSGGSGAAVSAYLAPAAIGSETAGSIRGPAAWCGIVGLKPTYGRVSRYGVVAMGSSLDCPGPMTITVEDAAYLLEIIAGNDSFDATSSSAPTEAYRKKLSEKRTLTIGIPDIYFEGGDSEVAEAARASIKVMEKQGHTVKKIELMNPRYAISVYTILQRAEVSSNLSRYTGIRYGDDRSYFGDEAKKRIMLGTYTLSYGYYDAYYKKAQRVRTLIVEDFKRVFGEVDVIVAPAMSTAAIKLGDSSKYSFFGELADVLTEPSAIAGIPAISVPVGLTSKGLPIGMQIMGNYFDEATILNLAYQFERETEFFGVIKNGIKNYKD